MWLNAKETPGIDDHKTMYSTYGNSTDGISITSWTQKKLLFRKKTTF